MKSLKPSDYDLICIVFIEDPRVCSSLILEFDTQVSKLDMLIRILMDRHIPFSVGYYGPSDDVVLRNMEVKFNFVYGLRLSNEKLICRPVST